MFQVKVFWVITLNEAQNHNPEDLAMNLQCHENVKSYIRRFFISIVPQFHFRMYH